MPLKRRKRARRNAESAALERERVLALLKQFGWNATSFQVLEPDFRYWFGDEQACVAYVDTGRAWVAGGAPIAAEERLGEVAAAFIAAARARERRVAFFATEERFTRAAPCASVLVGEQPVWNPSEWRAVLGKSRSLREQLRRARAKGVKIRRIDAAELAPGSATRHAIERLIRRWLRARPMAPMGFLVRVHPFEFAEERRIFVAELGERMVGLVCAVPVFRRKGWFIEDLLRAPNAPNGTTELLFDRALSDAAELGSEYVTLGLSPLAGPVSGFLRTARRFGKGLYDFSGLQAFKAKLGPSSWTPIYLSYPTGRSALVAVYDSLVAFSRVGLLRFGVASFLRGPALVVRLLATLLVPWTLGLALVDPERWFPARWVQWAWVGFDVVLGLALFSLTLRWSRALVDVLLVAIALDACITLVEVLAFNVERLHTPLDVLALLAAVAAPSIATVVLWNARRRIILQAA